MMRTLNTQHPLGVRLVAWIDGRYAAVRCRARAVAVHPGGMAARLATAGLLLVAGPAESIAPNQCQGITSAWRGTWEVTVDYIDRKTGALVATDVTTAAVCPGMPIKPPLLNTQLHCSGSGGDRALDLSCHAKRTLRLGCNVFVDVDFESVRDGDAWNGAGHWTAKVVGQCEHLDFGEDIVVSGRRLSREAACGSQEPSLVERFFTHSALIPVLGSHP